MTGKRSSAMFFGSCFLCSSVAFQQPAQPHQEPLPFLCLAFPNPPSLCRGISFIMRLPYSHTKKQMAISTKGSLPTETSWDLQSCLFFFPDTIFSLIQSFPLTRHQASNFLTPYLRTNLALFF